MNKIICILFCTISLLSCFSNPKISIYELKELQKGMVYSEVVSRVRKKPVNEFEIRLNSSPSNKYFILVYEIQGSQGFLGVGRGYDSDYFAVFKNDTLMYMGYPFDMNRHPDTLLNEIGTTAVAEYEKIK
ncbi:MAG TPA: hypothetical protein PLW09_08045 [Candidatus Kapabacteria bacterium]|nr:hypothetical protein [Candidatus Kapabacteria bacterium]